MKCLRCEAAPSGDWCGLCGTALCEQCFEDGCCGVAPAPSGIALELGGLNGLIDAVLGDEECR